MGNDDYRSLHRVVDAFLSRHPPSATEAFDCPYLPARSACNEGFRIEGIDGRVYRALMDRGFRRSGQIVYRPACSTCVACRPLRIHVADFRPTRSQRRVQRLNEDIEVSFDADPQPDEAKWAMFRSYLDARHDGAMAGDYDDFVHFLYDSPVESLEIDYRLEGRLVGVSMVDVCGDALSSVYMFFDPEVDSRSLGTYSVIREVDYCRSRGMNYYYLGYYIENSRTMAYKLGFRPHELLDTAFRWVRSGDANG